MYCLNARFVSLAIFCIGLWSVVGPTHAKFPDDPKPCKYGDAECIVEKINYFLKEKNQGDSSLNLVKIDPLGVSKISIKQGAESPVNIDLVFSNTKVIGLGNAVATSVKGFGKDPTGKHEIHITLKNVNLIGDYKISGKVLILPINGAGKSNMTMVNCDLIMRFMGSTYEKDGSTYMRIGNMKMTTKPERIYYNFGNLFNGDKTLGDNMNLFLNENWKDIYNEVRVSFTDAFAKIFEAVINNVFAKYPYEKYFLQE